MSEIPSTFVLRDSTGRVFRVKDGMVHYWDAGTEAWGWSRPVESAFDLEMLSWGRVTDDPKLLPFVPEDSKKEGTDLP